MYRVDVVALSVAAFVLSAGCATSERSGSVSDERGAAPAPVIDPASIQLTKPWHFATPDGSDVVADAGTYHVESGESSQLHLSPADGKAPLIIAALKVEHDVELLAPLALIIPIEADMQHIILARPDGKALDAVGSSSGIITRGPLKPIPSGLLAQALSAKVSPASAVLQMPKILLPVEGAIAIRGQVVVKIQFPQMGIMPFTQMEFIWLDAPPGSAPTTWTTDTGAVVQGFRADPVVYELGRWQVRVRMVDNVDNPFLAKPGPWSLPTEFRVIVKPFS